ncbi:MAG: flavin reductase family protein [Sutterella sp.]
MDQSYIVPVAPDKVYRLLNIGATTLVSASSEGTDDVMAAAWATALDVVPAKATVVIDRTHFTRPLMEKSGYFALQLPTVAIADVVMNLGSVSKNDDAEKLEKSGAKLFRMQGFDLPLVEGCAAWIVFRILPEAHVEKTYDLFIGEAVAAWADERVFREGHWQFETAPDDMRTLHYVAGGHFYAIGKAVEVPGYDG